MKRISDKLTDDGVESLRLGQEFEREGDIRKAISCYQRTINLFQQSGTEKEKMQYIYDKLNELKTLQRKRLTKRYGALIIISLISILISAALLGFPLIILFGVDPGYDKIWMLWNIVTPLLIIFIPSVMCFIGSIYKLFRTRKQRSVNNI